MERLAAKGYTLKDANRVIVDFIDVIGEALVDGEEVPLRLLGTFKVVPVKERVSGRDLKTGEPMISPAHMRPKFSPSDNLRKAVRDGIWRP